MAGEERSGGRAGRGGPLAPNFGPRPGRAPVSPPGPSVRGFSVRPRRAAAGAPTGRGAGGVGASGLKSLQQHTEGERAQLNINVVLIKIKFSNAWEAVNRKYYCGMGFLIFYYGLVLFFLEKKRIIWGKGKKYSPKVSIILLVTC